MRVLLVNQFYPPDMAPTGQCLHDLARCLVSRGHSVEVLCSRGSYEGGGAAYPAFEVVDGVQVSRLAAFSFGRRGAGRAADYASFLLAAGWRGALGGARYDVTVCLTTPPYVGWVVPRALGGRAGAVVQWVMDLYPEVLAAHGALGSGGLLFRALRGLSRRQLSRSALVLALGGRSRERVLSAAPGARVEAVPLWDPFEEAPSAAAVREWRARRGWGEGDVALLYSGNMGLGHRLGEFLEASLRTGPGVAWGFAGGGARRGEVEAFVGAHPSARVALLPYVGREELSASLAAADVHLLSVRSPWQGLIVPSKLQAAFALGRPVVYVGPSDAEPAEWVAESGGGWAVGEGDVAGLVAAVAAASSAAERARRGEAGRAFALRRFSRAANTARIAELLEGADPGGRRLLGRAREGQRVVLQGARRTFSRRFLALAGSAEDFPYPPEPPAVEPGPKIG